MALAQNKDLADKLDRLSTKAVKTNLVPLITKNGILMGSFLIQPKNGMFDIKEGSQILYTTFTKSAAMIVVRMIVKNARSEEIFEIIEADRVAFSARNDLELYKYHYENAEKRRDFSKRDIFLSRFEVTNDRYQRAKKMLHKSYSSLFYLGDK